MEVYLEKLRELVKTIRDEGIRKIVEDMLSNPKLSFASVEPRIALEECPAAPRKHHLFPGGLALHTYAMTRIALAIANTLEEVYGVKTDRDLIIAVAILHDLYKFYQYDRDEVNGGYRPRDDWYLSHDYALVAELARRGADDRLIRIASEVHGVAPITTIEGLVVHLADSVDARIGEVLQNAVLSKAKDIEASMGCKQVQLFIESVKRFGIGYLVNLAYREPEKLRELLASLCTEMKGTTSKQ